MGALGNGRSHLNLKLGEGDRGETELGTQDDGRYRTDRDFSRIRGRSDRKAEGARLRVAGVDNLRRGRRPEAGQGPR